MLLSPKSKNLSLLLASLFCSQSLGAEEEKSYTLEKSVVSASGFSQELKEAPASISVVSKKELESKPFKDIGEALSLVPGVSIDTNAGQNGAYPISIRGMPPSYTLILIDGKRQDVTSGAFPNGYADFTFAGFMPPLAMIERIEVIRGPMSTLYGSDAIGGVVNIITKKTLDKWNTSFSLESTFEKQKYFGNIYSGSFYTAGPIDKAKKWGLSFRGREQYRSFVPYGNLTLPQDDTKYIAGKVSVETNNYNVGGRLSYKPDDKNHFYFDGMHADQWMNNTRPDIYSLGTNKDVHALRTNLILAHLGNYEFGRTDTSIQYNSTQMTGRPTSSTNRADRGLRGDDVIIDSKAVIPFGKSWYSNKLTLGARYWFTSMEDKASATDFMYQHSAALFTEDEWSFTDDLFLTLGVRGNWNSAFGFNVSPRAYLVYNTTDYLTLKGGVSTGYKTPNVNQLITGQYGYTRGGSLYGNPSLRPESSVNFELSALSETEWTDIGVTGFYNLFRDKLSSIKVLQNESAASAICTDIKGCSYGYNADGAKTYGAEVFFAIKPIDMGFGNLGLNLNYTFTRSIITSGTEKGLPLSNVPEHNLNGTINYSLSKIGVYLRGEFKANQIHTEGRVTTYKQLQDFRDANPGTSLYYKPYFLLHIGGNYNITPTIRLNAGIYNLLNHNFVDYSLYVVGKKQDYYNNYAYIQEGRRYFVSLNMDF